MEDSLSWTYGTGADSGLFKPQTDPNAHEIAKKNRSEDVLSASGIVLLRTEENINPKIPTGRYEVKVDRSIFSTSRKPLPFRSTRMKSARRSA